MKRAWYILAMAAALAWGARETQALVIGVQATWAIGTANLQVGSIVQVVAYKNGEEIRPPSQTDASGNFQIYGQTADSENIKEGDVANVYLANTVPDGHELVYTGDVSLNASGTEFVFKEYIDIDPQYDTIYIRVFSATEFTEGAATTSWWGVSGTNAVVGDAGLGYTWFPNVALTNQDYFEVIPEPGTAWLLLCGLGGVACAGWRRGNGVERSGKTGDGER